jgi:predicted ribosomally synthesized peptide with nif11-like leader
MSSENIAAFLEKARTDESLSTRIAAAYAEVQAGTARSLAELSVAAGLPFTAEEFLGSQQSTLEDESMEDIAGGLGASHKYGFRVVPGRA